MSVKDKSGMTVRQQLEHVWKITGNKPAQLENLVELPRTMFLLWKWFVDLDASRTSSGFGVNPLSYSDILSYSILENVEFTSEEVQIIKKLDEITLKHYADLSAKNKAKTSTKK